MKKLIITALMGIVLLGNTNTIEVAEQPQSNNLITNIEYVEYMPNQEQTKILTLKDNSSIVYNVSQNLYTFYPSCLGDWFYSFDNAADLKNCVITYLEISPKVVQKENIKVVDNYYKANVGMITMLSNDSYILYNTYTNTYIFQATELGDWTLQLDSIEELTNCVKTYIDIKSI